MKKSVKLKIMRIVLLLISALILVIGFAFFETGIIKAIFIGGGLSISFFSDKIWKQAKKGDDSDSLSE